MVAKPASGKVPFFASLTVRIGLVIVLVVMVVSTVISTTFLLADRRAEAQRIVNEGRTFGVLTSPALYDDYVRLYTQSQPSDFAAFTERLQTRLDQNKDIVSASLLTASGTILFDSAELTAGKYEGRVRTAQNAQTTAALSRGEVSVFDIMGVSPRQTEILVPISEKIDGQAVAARYVVSHARLSERLGGASRRPLLVAGMALVVALVMVIYLQWRLARPLTRLTAVADRLRFGKFDVEAEQSRGDEIGRLGQAINVMAASIKTSQQDLETKVYASTRELQAAQARLQESVKQDEALLSSIGDGVVVTDQAGYIVLINEPAIAMLKLSPGAAYGKRYDQVWSVETGTGQAILPENAPISQAIRTGAAVHTSNYYFARHDIAGRIVARVPVAMTTTPVVINDKTVGTINVFRDITYEKDVDRMKTEFISLASHQLRTPLSAIRWFGEMLLNGDTNKLQPDQEEFVRNIYQSTERMIYLINSLLNISRIESGRIIVDPQPTDVRQLVGGIISDLRGKTEQKKQTLTVQVQDGLPLINLDPNLVGQVYLNLLTNAIKYTPKNGKIAVQVTQQGNEILSQVSDNGYGIPHNQQPRVFEKFFRAENIVKFETDGTGLGLYLVKAIVESSGGRIWFVSEEGKGTTFYFTLPMTGMQAKKGEVKLELYKASEDVPANPPAVV